jgi:hypothetical protein
VTAVSFEEPGSDMEVRASAQEAAPREPWPLVRWRPLATVLSELRGVQKLQDELLAAGQIRQAAELSPDVDRLTREYVRRRDAPRVEPPC